MTIWVLLMALFLPPLTVLIFLLHCEQLHYNCPSVGGQWPTQSQDLKNFLELKLKRNLPLWRNMPLNSEFKLLNKEFKQHQTLLYFNVILWA